METNKIYLGDCLELMKDIPSGSVDMILCDLPYGTTACKWDSLVDLDKLWLEYKRIIKPYTDMNLFICGESYSSNQGWIEGALLTSNKVVDMLKTKSYKKYKSFTDNDIKESKSLIIINNNVYDISINNWIINHPGGDIIKKYIGKDATKIFNYIHPKYATHLLEQLFVGVKV